MTGFTTTILHHDSQQSVEHGSIHQPVQAAVTFGYRDARDLAAVFQGKQSGYRYSRQGNPTVTALENSITAMEQGVASLCFSSGMAAIGALPLALLKAGDHVVSSVFLFGNTSNLWQTVTNLGVNVSLVDATCVEQVANAITSATRLVFVETIANPGTQVADLEKIGALCQARGILFVVDNTLTTPYLFRPKTVGAGLVVNSLTKAIAGHGAALGGCITDTGRFEWRQYPHIAPSIQKQPVEMWGMAQLRSKSLRDFGACLSAEAAHQILLGAETMALRMDRQCMSAAKLAAMLAAHPKVDRVNYPGLPQHGQHQLANKLFKAYGSLFSFELKPELNCFDFINRLKLAISATHLGDNRTLIIPVAHTIFFEMGPERRAAMGMSDSLIRVSVGIEDSADLIADFEQALR
jgi:O-acetylhomoserine (thiol)-lyase